MPKIRHIQSIFQSPWLELRAKTVEDHEHPFYSVRLADYACVVAVTRGREIVLVRQFRSAVEQSTLEIPSGLVDAGESPLDSVRRELWEETGYRAEQLFSLGPALMPDTGRLENRLWCFAAPGVELDPGWRPCEPGIEALCLDQTAMEKALDSGEFSHALHVAAVYLAQRKGLLF